MKEITPHEGSPGIAVRVNHQDAEGCFGNEINHAGIGNVEVSKSRKEEHTDQDGTKLVCIQYKEGQRQIQLQESTTDDAHIAGKHRQQQKPQRLSEAHGPLRRVKTKITADEINRNEPEYFAED